MKENQEKKVDTLTKEIKGKSGDQKRKKVSKGSIKNVNIFYRYFMC